MEELVERELTVPDGIDEVWESLAEPRWLGDGAKIDLREAGEVRAGERTGFVEAGTHIRVTESRPLAILDGRDLAIEFGGMSGGTGPMASAGLMLAGAPA